MKYLDVEWGPDMPYCETLGHLTESMLNDDAKVWEIPEDKSSLLFDGSIGYGDDHRKDSTGIYHIRSGTLPAYLLATKKYGNTEEYWKYLKQQPKSEFLRQSAFYSMMGGDVTPIIEDCGITRGDWDEYIRRFKEYHGF